VRAAWQSIRGKVEAQRQSLRAPLSRAVVEGVDGGAITLALPQAVFMDVLRDHVALIERAVEDVLGTPLHVKLRVDGTVRTKAPATDLEDPDELFNYASERIPKKP
jgi:hypothetical protein